MPRRSLSTTANNTLQVSGTGSQGNTLVTVDVNLSAPSVTVIGATVDLNVIARDNAVGGSAFNRLDMHGEYDIGTGNCLFWEV